MANNIARTIVTIVINQHDFVDIFIKQIAQTGHQRLYVHFLIVTRYHKGNGASETFVRRLASYKSYGFAKPGRFFSSHSLPSWMFVGLVTLICSTIFVTALHLRKTAAVRRQQEFNLFLVGALIYVGTFIFYLITTTGSCFLSFVFPFLESRRFPFGGLLVTLIIAAMNELAMYPLLGRVGVATSWLAKIGVFIALSAYLAALVLAMFRWRDNSSMSKIVDEPTAGGLEGSSDHGKVPRPG
jgi:hypothetical protein